MIQINLDYRRILLNFESASSNTRTHAKAFLSNSMVGQRYLLGRNKHALALASVIDIDGFIDDYAKSGTTWHGKPVIKMAELSPNSSVVNCSMSISPVTAMARLKESKSSLNLNYSDILRERPDLIPTPDFVQTTRQDYEENEVRLLTVFAGLADQQSRSVMKSLAGYRLTGDPRYMQDFKVRFSDQYFEDFIDLKNAVFVDAGGFDGDTTSEFCKRYPDYKKVFFFEPSSANIKSAKTRLMDRRNIAYIQLGLSNSNGNLWFNPDAGPASAVALDGTERIEVTTLDDFTSERVTYIKMDLEGWELKALSGAARHISHDHPTLAISVYHHASDFWRVFEYVMSIRSDYSVYLRHYTEGWSESIMFFVPVKSA